MFIFRILSAICLLLMLSPAWAGRVFTHSYLATTAEEGEFEYAQWVTLKDDIKADPSFRQYAIRHEFEFGLSDIWQLALYVPDWTYTEGDSVNDGAEFTDVGIETIYQLRDPKTSDFGIAVYGEARIGDETFVLEPKLIIDKRINDWILVWNLTLEAEWEDEDYEERSAELATSFGVSRRITSHWRLGAEATWAVEYDDFSDREEAVSYLGPNAYFKGHEWWVGGSLLKQLSDERDSADLVARVILGVEFE